MRRLIQPVLLVLTVLLILYPVKAGKAGVGVLNVTPTYKYIKLVNGEYATELRLSISDYNSWKDIWKVEVLAESKGKTCALFTFLHYTDEHSFDEVNIFKEEEGEGYLLLDLCDVKRSLSEKSIDDRCLINVSFIFKPIPYCTKLIVNAYDRENKKASIEIDYGLYEGQRNKDIIVPFWTGEPIRISPDIPDVIAGSVSVTSVAFIVLRGGMKKHEKE